MSSKNSGNICHKDIFRRVVVFQLKDIYFQDIVNNPFYHNDRATVTPAVAMTPPTRAIFC